MNKLKNQMENCFGDTYHYAGRNTVYSHDTDYSMVYRNSLEKDHYRHVSITPELKCTQKLDESRIKFNYLP